MRKPAKPPSDCEPSQQIPGVGESVTVRGQPRSMKPEGAGGRLNPSCARGDRSAVELFERVLSMRQRCRRAICGLRTGHERWAAARSEPMAFQHFRRIGFTLCAVTCGPWKLSYLSGSGSTGVSEEGTIVGEIAAGNSAALSCREFCMTCVG